MTTDEASSQRERVEVERPRYVNDGWRQMEERGR